MSENVIFCYSGTGNCLDMAKTIARKLGDTDIILMRKEPAVTDVRDAKRVGFVFPCYGGGLDDNASHFDLVSIGGYDFVILYLGCYLEDDPATLAWANEVLRTYSGRNAVIAAHEYLNKHAQWSGDRAEVIWNELVVPNDNVKLILCGHNEGAADRLRQVGDSGRYVLELLAATAEMTDLHPETPVITMSMGALGGVSRLCGEAFGSAMTFANPGTASAPGQVPLDVVNAVLDSLAL